MKSGFYGEHQKFRNSWSPICWGKLEEGKTAGEEFPNTTFAAYLVERNLCIKTNI